MVLFQMRRHGTYKIINLTAKNSRNYTFLFVESLLGIDNPSICRHALLLHEPYWSYFDLQTLSLTSRSLKSKYRISKISEIVLFIIMVSQKEKFRTWLRTECFFEWSILRPKNLYPFLLEVTSLYSKIVPASILP